jgi:hypothetical protein
MCDHFFDGTKEDEGLVEATKWIINNHPKARLETFKWQGEKENPNYYHNLSRKFGTEIANGDWLLFLDADEILDDSFGEWSKEAMTRPNCYCLPCYWYFRIPEYRSKTTEGCGLLIRKTECNWDLEQNLERQQFHSLPNFVDAEGKPLAHHFSWVRTKDEMINKVKKWGHKNDKDWISLVSEEFSRPFNGTDFVHGYEYETIENDIYNSNDELKSLLITYVQNPCNPMSNFNLAVFYEGIGQTASALSYYLRAAERTESKLLQFECLLRASMCFEKQGSRNYTVKGLLQHALAIQPLRPEGYYLLSRFYEREKSWQDSYMIASMGNQVSNNKVIVTSPLITKIDYPGDYALLYQKAVSSWWCGLCDESRFIFKSLLKDFELDSTHMKSVINNLHFLKAFSSFETYDKNQTLRFPFSGSERINRNYSEAYQDLFVLGVLDGKKNGTYLEIGAGDPTYGSNTYLLEKEFGWKGASMDLSEEFVKAHKTSRSNECVLKDATATDYASFLGGLGFPNEIEYLQIDCDPPSVTFEVLKSIPFEKYKFGVITYEHDMYCDDTKSFQEKAKNYLESQGYFRVVNNISPDDFRSYEDWWVHPDLVDMKRVDKMTHIGSEIKKAKNYITKG